MTVRCMRSLFSEGMSTTSTSDHPRVNYSYGYQNTPTGGDTDSLVIKLKCPGISLFKWCLKLYSLDLGGLGLLISFIWVCFHLYVLSQTSLQETQATQVNIGPSGMLALSLVIANFVVNLAFISPASDFLNVIDIGLMAL